MNATHGGDRHLAGSTQIALTACYVFGIGANVCALRQLARSATPRNRRQTFMLRCLAVNDLVALAGSWALMYTQIYIRAASSWRWFCALRVLIRAFGFWSGCVAIVMAVERFTALATPFLYQKRVTYKLIKRVLLGLWLAVFVLVLLPFTGFGLYYRDRRCARYRQATHPLHRGYAYVMFAFGVLMCVIIVVCNLGVVRALRRVGPTLGRTTVLGRELAFNHATPDELNFARLMVVLCVFFVVCWVPQMVTIPLAQLNPHSPSVQLFYRLADVCLALNFILDPVIYVLLRRPHRFCRVFKPACQLCFPGAFRGSSVRTVSQEVSRSSQSIRSGQHHPVVLKNLPPEPIKVQEEAYLLGSPPKAYRPPSLYPDTSCLLDSPKQ